MVITKLFEPNFPKYGDYIIHVEYLFEGVRENFEINIFAVTPEKNSLAGKIIFNSAGTIILLIIVFAGIIKKNIKAAIIWSLILAVAAFLSYSLYVTIESDPSSGIVTCPKTGECIWTAHVHAFVPILICDKEFRLPIEVGKLQNPHTHEEKNIIHWHDKLPYDKTTNMITNLEPLTLGAFFDSIDVEFSEKSIDGKTNGDLCPNNKAGDLKVFVNGKLNTQYGNYIWKDKDVISIFFDDTPVETIEKELMENPVTFPALGRG